MKNVRAFLLFCRSEKSNVLILDAITKSFTVSPPATATQKCQLAYPDARSIAMMCMCASLHGFLYELLSCKLYIDCGRRSLYLGQA